MPKNTPFIQQTLAELKNLYRQLEFASNEEYPPIEEAQIGLEICTNSIGMLREKVIRHQFQHPEAEIYFFKHIKPKFMSSMMFYQKVWHIEVSKPVANKSATLLYYNRFHDEIAKRSEENKDVYSYYRSKLTHFDLQYFTRSKNPLSAQPHAISLPISFDFRFDTPADPVIAAFHSDKRLLAYLNKQENDTQKSSDKPVVKSKLQWTGRKVELVELVYALHAIGKINNGEAELKEIAGIFEQGLGYSLDKMYSTFSEIKARHEPTKFLLQMRKVLEERIEQNLL